MKRVVESLGGGGITKEKRVWAETVGVVGNGIAFAVSGTGMGCVKRI